MLLSPLVRSARHAHFDSMVPPSAIDDILGLLPRGWLGESRAIRVADGMSGAEVLHLSAPEAGGEAYLKLATGRSGSELREEIARGNWLRRRGIRIPPLIKSFDDGHLVASLSKAIAGKPPQLNDATPEATLAIVGRAISNLHALPAADCPYDESVERRLARAREAVARGAIDASHFAERNRRLSPRELLDCLTSRIPPAADPVVVHGDATFENMLIDDDEQLWLIDCGHAGRSDRALDLACVVDSIEDHFGFAYAEPFLRAYGGGVAPARLAFFKDLYELF